MGRSTFRWGSSCTSAAPSTSLLLFFALNTLSAEEKGINHNYLSALWFCSHLSPSISLCPVLFLFLSCSTSQEINTAVEPFIYLEGKDQDVGHRCESFPPFTILPQTGSVPDLVEISSFWYIKQIFSCKQTPFLAAAAKTDPGCNFNNETRCWSASGDFILIINNRGC